MRRKVAAGPLGPNFLISSIAKRRPEIGTIRPVRVFDFSARNYQLASVEVHILPLKREDFTESSSGIQQRDENCSKVRIRCVKQLLFVGLLLEPPVARNLPR